ncbi:ATP-binding protein [Candidatus Odyssella thessalonicensis]|uniref:ATP-binding protein n=1 Tax=Candidatus Odyssella thessalonicensis TaxID=84647 RepID=UPI000225A9E0|nr:ATP-binding protein [Candidatus Odyssella thessalonicensis]
MTKNELAKTIIKLLELDKEGEYWDFKEQPGTCLDLVHDIICLANNPHYIGERYLIYGVKENPNINKKEMKYNIIGIEKNKLDQANIINTLRNSGFSNGNFPDIRLENITVFDKNLSIIVVADHPNLRPYTLGKLYTAKEGKTKLYPGAIYTRVQDTNTPKDKTASLSDCEKIWRQRFGIDEPVFDRFKRLLLEPVNWAHNPGMPYLLIPDDSERHRIFPVYHKFFPEFQIELTDWEERNGDTFCYLYYIPESYWGKVRFKYHNVVLSELSYVCCDDFRILFPVPRIFSFTKIDHFNQNYFHYIIMDDLEGYFLHFLNVHQDVSNNKAILIFKNRLQFDAFISDVQKDFKNKALSQIKSAAFSHDYVKSRKALQDKLLFQLNLRKFYDEWRFTY